MKFYNPFLFTKKQPLCCAKIILVSAKIFVKNFHCTLCFSASPLWFNVKKSLWLSESSLRLSVKPLLLLNPRNPVFLFNPAGYKKVLYLN